MANDKKSLKDIKTKNELKNDLKREKKDQQETGKTKNKSIMDLTKLIVKSTDNYGQNFSFCDFKHADLRGQIFTRANFCFARNMDKIIKDETTDFPGCNFTGVILKELPFAKEEMKKKKCNVGKLFEKFTDEEIKDLCEGE